MTNLVAAYQRRDIHDAQKILRGQYSLIVLCFLTTYRIDAIPHTTAHTENKATILDDPFIKFYIDDVLRSLRTQYLIDLIKPYTRMELKWLGRVSPSARQSHPSLLLTSRSLLRSATQRRHRRGRGPARQPDPRRQGQGKDRPGRRTTGSRPRPCRREGTVPASRLVVEPARLDAIDCAGQVGERRACSGWREGAGRNPGWVLPLDR